MTYFLDASEVRTSSLGDTSARRLFRSRRFSLTYSYERCAFALLLSVRPVSTSCEFIFLPFSLYFSHTPSSLFRNNTAPLFLLRFQRAHYPLARHRSLDSVSLSLPAHLLIPFPLSFPLSLVVANTTPTILAYFVAPSLFHSLPLSDDLNRFSFSDAHLSPLSLVHFAGPFLSLTH